MPNWNWNRLEITGPRFELEEMNKKILESNSILDALCPLPFNWDHQGAVDYWGTKWSDEISDEPFLSDDDDLHYLYVDFPTAWAPPSRGIQRISGNYPNCTFGLAYYESGSCFAGFDVFKNGNQLVAINVEIPDFTDYEDDPDQHHEDENDFQSDLINKMEEALYSLAGPMKARTIL